MKSLERRFNNIRGKLKNSDWSNYLVFAEAVREQYFSKQAIHRWFYKLVDQDDYASKEKKEILSFLTNHSNPPRTTQNGTETPTGGTISNE